MTNRAGPLAGVSVVELAGLGPAPFACLLLAELGAEVVRVERPGGSGLGGIPLAILERSRPCLAVDLKDTAGQEVLLRLVERADVLVEGYRPGVTERLGIGPADCLARNPRLIYARMTGWGQDGPLRDRPGHDITYAALTGVLHSIGTRDKPVNAVNYVADFGGGSLYLIVGILAALLERTRSGTGQVVDAAMVDGTASLATMVYGVLGEGAWHDAREANLLDGGAPFYDTYRCADGRFVAVGALEPQFYAVLLRELGLDDRLVGEQYDRRHWPAQRQAFAEVFAGRTRDAWATALADTDACVAPVLSLTEAPRHPHLQARGTFVTLDGVAQPRVAPRFSRTPGREPSPPREVGADTVNTLMGWGFPAAEVDRLRADGVVYQAPGEDHVVHPPP
ncbi:MAG TPA: CaiB/BaiF CoA-transferase family protein [Dermatophilaceae bacterium]|nr:CaiB/BaiF CoA-transferase family protein [Dermatophilaceae bacterium]